MDKKRGILLIAVGHPYYARMAYNLAMSIKCIEDTPIALVHSEYSMSHLSTEQLEYFDELIYVPEYDAKAFGGKLQIDLHSPFEETLYLDVDMAWLPKRSPTMLFEELKDAEFTSITEGYFDVGSADNKNASQKYYFWADLNEIVEKYKLVPGNRIYQWRSEVMYFKKTEKVRQFFKLAREIHANPLVKSVMFGSHVPDELGINISAAVNDVNPHAYKWTPALWPRLHGGATSRFEEIYNQYYLLSCGSNYVTPDIRRLYDRIIGHACFKFKKQYVFPLMNKKEFLPDRAKF